jgi:hypothetical protein
VKFYISGADREGEGEYKIFEHIRHCESIHNANPIHHKFCHDDSFLIVGNDSDLVALSLLEHGKNISFLRVLNMNLTHLYNINDIRNSILQNILGDPEKTVEDFVFLALLNGSDYLPKLMGYNFLKAWRYYKYLKSQPQYEQVHIIAAKSIDSFVYNLTFLSQILKFCRYAEGEVKTFVIHGSNNSFRCLKIPAENPKAVVNNLLSSFCGQTPLFNDNDWGEHHTTSHRFSCEMFMIKPEKIKDGVSSKVKSVAAVPKDDLILLGSGVGATIKEAHYHACIEALRPSSPLFDNIGSRMNQEDLQKLINYFALKNWSQYQDSDFTENLSPSEASSDSTSSLNETEKEKIFHYFQMLSWVMFYWSPHHPLGIHYYRYLQSPSIVHINCFASANPILSVATKCFWPENSSNDTNHSMYRSKYGFMPPLSFCLAISVPSLGPELIPTILQPLAREFGPVVDFQIDAKMNSVSLIDRTEQFCQTAFNYLCNLLNRNQQTLQTPKSTVTPPFDGLVVAQQQLQFQPSLLFFTDDTHSPIANNLSSDTKNILSLDAASLRRMFQVSVVRQHLLKRRIVCLAEEAATGNKTIRQFTKPLGLVLRSSQKQRYAAATHATLPTLSTASATTQPTTKDISLLLFRRCHSSHTLIKNRTHHSILVQSMLQKRWQRIVGWFGQRCQRRNSFVNLLQLFLIRR